MRVTLEEDHPGELDACDAVEKAITAVRKAVPDHHAAEEAEQSKYQLMRSEQADAEQRAHARLQRMVADVERVLRRMR